jgi:hypothetical protein
MASNGYLDFGAVPLSYLQKKISKYLLVTLVYQGNTLRAFCTHVPKKRAKNEKKKGRKR